MENVQPLWNTVWWILTKLKHTLTIQFNNHTPWCLHKGAENISPHKNLQMDVYSSFIHNCQNLKQPRYASTGEWINKLWYIQMMEYYSALKRNERSSQKTWEKLKCILLSERNQSEKATYHIIPTT